MSVCCGWCGQKLKPNKKHTCKKEVIADHIHCADHKVSPFMWMKSWLQSYDASNKGLNGRKIMEWVEDQRL